MDFLLRIEAPTVVNAATVMPHQAALCRSPTPDEGCAGRTTGPHAASTYDTVWRTVELWNREFPEFWMFGGQKSEFRLQVESLWGAVKMI